MIGNSQGKSPFSLDCYLSWMSLQPTSYSYAYSGTAGLGLIVTRVRPQANQTGSATTTTTTQYDSLGRVVTVSYSDGTTSRGFDYDVPCCWTPTGTNQKGRLAVMGGGAGTANWSGSLFSYDAMGRVTTIWSCGPASCGNAYMNNRGVSFSYDWAGNPTGTADGATGAISYGRSIAGEITSVTNTSYTNLPYNPPNLVSNVVNGPNGPVSYTLGNGLNVYRSYDTLGRYNGEWVCNGPAGAYCPGGTQIYATTNSWKGSQMTGQSDTSLAQGALFGYGDGFNRITSRTVTYGTLQNYTYAYDRYGNRVSQTPLQSGYSFNPTINPANNHITTSGYTYDAAGNMTSDSVHTYTYDAEGNITAVDGGSTAKYVYDDFNRRIHAQTPSGTNEFVYDYAGRRISTWVASNNFGDEGRIYWDGRQIAYRSIDGTTYFDHQDTLGTERMRTTYAGTVGSSYTSLPWGDGYTATVNNSGGDQDNGHFARLERDPESGTEHAQFRNYASAQGRWLAPDPYMGSYDLTNPQSFNRYAYVLNNPMSLMDPGGLDTSQPTACGTDDNGHPIYCITATTGQDGGGGGWQYGDFGYADMLHPRRPFAREPSAGGGGGGRFSGAPSNAPAVAGPSPSACTAAGAVAGASAGALIGEGVGGLVGGGVGTLVAPGVGTIGGRALGGSGGATVGAAIGGVLGGIVGNVLCSKGGGPSFGGNQRENKQANDAKNQAERITGKQFTPALERMFHDEVTGMNYSYQELVQVAVEILEMHG
jgi:RHS repeat-associated protein